MNDGDFAYIQNLMRDNASVVIEKGKEYLVEVRLTQLARKENLGSLQELINMIRNERSGTHLRNKAIEAMLTHETMFFRDIHPFEALRNNILPRLLPLQEAGGKPHIWSAACSSGQEAYSIAMVVRDNFPSLAESVKIIGSDVSGSVLSRAQQGRFSQLEVNRGLPPHTLAKYFRKEGTDWLIDENLRRMVEFRNINLCRDWPLLPRMNIIFMRNVLIYFDIETKKSILEKVRQHMRPDSYLFLGGAETTLNLHEAFERIQAEKASYYHLRNHREEEAQVP